MKRLTKTELQFQVHELTDALGTLAAWATGGDRVGNPYCKEPVEFALKVLAKVQGMKRENWADSADSWKADGANKEQATANG